MILFRILKLWKHKNYKQFSQILLKYNPTGMNEQLSTKLIPYSKTIPENKIENPIENDLPKNYNFFREEDKSINLNHSELYKKMMKLVTQIYSKNPYEMCQLSRYIDIYCDKYLRENEQMITSYHSLIIHMAYKSKQVNNCFL